MSGAAAAASLFGGGGSGGNTGGGPSPADFADVAFKQQQGKVAANSLFPGVGNSTGTVTALNANDLNALVNFAGLQVQQEQAANAAQSNLSGALSTLTGLFGAGSGAFGSGGGGGQSGGF